MLRLLFIYLFAFFSAVVMGINLSVSSESLSAPTYGKLKDEISLLCELIQNKLKLADMTPSMYLILSPFILFAPKL